jgi:large subunit ribosomal protein L5
LIAIVLPRVRDFRGLKPNAFDGSGNYNLGLSEQLVFPEVDADSVKHQQGLNITIVTSARTDAEAKVLLEQFGMPFQKTEGKGAA